jgi:hypothetical protein
LGFIFAQAESCFQVDSRPARQQVTRTVGMQLRATQENIITKVSTWVEKEPLYQPLSFASKFAKVFLVDIFAALTNYGHLI